jgi:threonine dehydratase
MSSSAEVLDQVNPDLVRAMARRIDGHIIRTPTILSEDLSRITGTRLFLKYENLQHTGAFKARGAAARLLGLDRQRTRGVAAMSAGNYAQGVAFFAASLGLPSFIVMPRHTPFLKVRRTQHYGANVVLEGETLSEALTAAQSIARQRDLLFIHPYDDDEVIAGQGTVALEMLTQVPALDVLIAPIGGGGLIGGCAVIAKEMKPGIEVVGVQTERYPSVLNALHARDLPCRGATLAEGIAVARTGVRTLPLIASHVDHVTTVSESAIERCIALLATTAKTVAEGAAAAALAAVLQEPQRYQGRNVGLVLSGGNIDGRMLSSVLMRDLQRNRQVITLSIEMPDKPGQLHAVSGLCAASGANVLEVSHDRFAMDLSASAALLNITLETRDQVHASELVSSLRGAGFIVSGGISEAGAMSSFTRNAEP